MYKILRNFIYVFFIISWKFQSFFIPSHLKESQKICVLLLCAKITFIRLHFPFYRTRYSIYSLISILHPHFLSFRYFMSSVFWMLINEIWLRIYFYLHQGLKMLKFVDFTTPKNERKTRVRCENDDETSKNEKWEKRKVPWDDYNDVEDDEGAVKNLNSYFLIIHRMFMKINVL